MLAAVAVVRVTSTVLSATSELDIVASWLQFANWHFLTDGASYKELFDGPSAVLHFWSLAIEEQLYLVVGVVAAVVVRESRHPDRLLGLVAAIGAAMSFALPFVFGFGVDRVYFGTDTRAGELFVGLVIAAVIAAPSRRRWLLRRARIIGGIAVLGLGVTAVLWLRIPAGDPWLNSGLLPLTALASSAVILGALVPGGPVWLLGCLAPVRWLGGISYALYLVHFPVFVIADRLQPDPRLIDTIGLVAISIALAVVSGRLLEWPVRRRRWSRRALVAGASTLGVVTAVALFVPAPAPRSEQMLARLEEAAPTMTTVTATQVRPVPRSTTTTTTVRSAPPTTAERRPPPVVGWYGDSVALSLALAMDNFGSSEEFSLLGLETRIGCGVAFSAGGFSDECDASLASAADRAAQQHATVALILSCQWELVAQVVPGETEPSAAGDAEFDQFVRDRYVQAMDRLRAAGIERFAWVTCPYQSSSVGVEELSQLFRDGRDPQRVDLVNGIVAELADVRDDVVLIDLATWVNGRVDDATLRPDGSHYEFEVDTGVAAELTGLLERAVD